MGHVEKFSNRPAFKHVDKERVLTFLRDTGTRNVLDVGCGVGNAVASLAESGFDAFGVTIDPDEIAASEVPERLVLADIQQAGALKKGPFDAIICFDCLEHLENPLAGLRNINSLLRPSGGAFVCYIPPEKWIECDYHVIVYTPRQMRWLLNLTGFRLCGTQGRYRYPGANGVTYFSIKESQGQLRPGRME